MIVSATHQVVGRQGGVWRQQRARAQHLHHTRHCPQLRRPVQPCQRAYLLRLQAQECMSFVIDCRRIVRCCPPLRRPVQPREGPPLLRTRGACKTPGCVRSLSTWFAGTLRGCRADLAVLSSPAAPACPPADPAGPAPPVAGLMSAHLTIMDLLPFSWNLCEDVVPAWCCPVGAATLGRRDVLHPEGRLTGTAQTLINVTRPRCQHARICNPLGKRLRTTFASAASVLSLLQTHIRCTRDAVVHCGESGSWAMLCKQTPPS